MTDSTYEQWDIVSSAGLTALVVAAGRAVDTHREDGLISDPYAEKFVEAANPAKPLPTRPTVPTDDSEDQTWQMMSGYMGTRTRFFDEYFATAGADGVRQVVILAARLDTRPYRLDWPAGTTVFEVDQSAVLDFKDEVLAREGATARCDRRRVAVDLRDDWAGALEAAGFDATRPTAWLAEGLLPYLPAETETALLEAVSTRSAVGSHIAVEDFTNITQQLADPAFRRISGAIGVEMSDLLFTDARPDPAAWLTERGWQVRSDVALDVAKNWGRTLDALTERLNGQSSLMAGRLSG